MKPVENTSASVLGKVTLITLVCFVFLVMALQGHAQSYPIGSLSGTGSASVNSGQFQAGPQMNLSPNTAPRGARVIPGYTLYRTCMVSIILTDMAGNSISRDDVTFDSGRFSWLINTGNLFPGNYLVRVVNGPSVTTQPLTIL